MNESSVKQNKEEVYKQRKAVLGDRSYYARDLNFFSSQSKCRLRVHSTTLRLCFHKYEDHKNLIITLTTGDTKHLIKFYKTQYLKAIMVVSGYCWIQKLPTFSTNLLDLVGILFQVICCLLIALQIGPFINIHGLELDQMFLALCAYNLSRLQWPGFQSSRGPCCMSFPLSPLPFLSLLNEAEMPTSHQMRHPSMPSYSNAHVVWLLNIVKTAFNVQFVTA